MGSLHLEVPFMIAIKVLEILSIAGFGVSWTTVTGGGTGISNVSDDTNPQLGGPLDLNNHMVLLIVHILIEYVLGSAATAGLLNTIRRWFGINWYCN